MTVALLLGVGLPAQGWERLGPEGGLVVSLGKGADGAIYLGTSDGHVFAGTFAETRGTGDDGPAGDGEEGLHWELRGRVGGRIDGIVARLLGDPRKAQRVFAAVWFREAGAGGGIFRSEDGGKTWVASGLVGEAARAVEFAPSDPAMLVAGTRSGVFRSLDGGKNWERISPPDDPELRNVDSIAVDPTDPRVIYAGTYHLPWKTTDGGKTWTSIAAGLIDDSDIMSFRIDATNPARVYLSACSGIYRSENRGGVWIKLQGIPYGARRTQSLVQDPGDPRTLYAGTTEGLWVTRDTGESWERTTPGDWVVNAVQPIPAAGGRAARLLLGTDAQGILISADAGRSFAPANRGFTHRVVKQLVVDSADPRHLLLLLERRGMEILESTDAGENWKALTTAEPSVSARPVAWSADRIERVYSSPWGWMAPLGEGGFWLWNGKTWRSWIPMAARLPASRAGQKSASSRAKPVVFMGVAGFSRDSAFLFSGAGLSRCERAGKCVTLPAFVRLVFPVAAIAVDAQTIVVVSAAKLGLSRDGGNTAMWRDLPVAAGEATWILRAKDGSGKLLLGTRRGLYLSHDTGEHWALAANGLPEAPVGVAVQGREGVLMSLAQGGLYCSRDGETDWTPLDRDAERSRIAGFSETQPGVWLAGSESEGLLRWTARVQ